MKTNIKKNIKIAGILFIILSCLQIFALCMRIYSVHVEINKLNYTWFDYACSGVEIVLSLVTGIIYLVLQAKKEEYILKQNKLVFILTIINILNSFAGWVISFWIEIVVEQARRLEYSYINPFGNSGANLNNGEVLKDENGNVIIKEGDYEVLKTETLTTRLDELTRLRNKNLITAEEYTKLRQEAIDKFLN